MTKEPKSLNYFEIHIKDLKREDEDLVTGQLFSMGAAGVSEILNFTQNDLKFEPEVMETTSLSVVAYFEFWNPQALENLRLLFPLAQVSVVEATHKDWMEEWKKGYEPFVLASNTWIVPSWRKPPPEAEHIIYIDPGMAFGTGTHETTKVCSQLIASYCNDHRLNSGSSKHGTRSVSCAVDIGTGTGILAMFMEKLGFDKIFCTDIDPECKRVTEENFAQNRIQKIIWKNSIEASLGPFDLLVANIIDGVLLELKGSFLQISNPATEIILSGILEENEKSFTLEFLENTPWKVHHRMQMKEWVGLWLKPRGPGIK